MARLLLTRWQRRIVIVVIGVVLTMFVPYGGPLFAVWAMATDGAEE